MRPGEVFTVATRADPENAPFNVVVHGQGISVWVNAGLDAEVFDAQGGLVPCAHQRPDGLLGLRHRAEPARLEDVCPLRRRPAPHLEGSGPGGPAPAPEDLFTPELHEDVII